jgi:anti-sigma regulatory factor (Ser/Thr protein kinase)
VEAQVAVEPTDIAVDGRAHAVQFYERDADLAQAVGRYLADGLSCGGVAIVIATEPHRRAFGVELEAAGLEPLDLRRDGMLVMLDAGNTMSRFMPGGRIDRDAFDAVIGSTMRAAAATGRPVRAFGEMVAVLWEAGDVLAAIELEKLWNELGDQISFSLLCGYPSTLVSAPEHSEALHEVCHLHSTVLGAAATPDLPRELSADFDPDHDAPARSRRLVADAMRKCRHHRDLLADAQLVASELTTNAVVHARSRFSVTVRCHDGAVRISVRDASSVTPTVREAGPAALFGRGMGLIATLSSGWGVDATRDGKVVWAELRAGTGSRRS